MSGFIGNDGSQLAGGLDPSNVIAGMHLDAQGNLKIAGSFSAGSPTDTFSNATTLTAATTFSGVPTISQLAANSSMLLANPGAQATFIAEIAVASAFVGTLSFYGLEPDGATLQLVGAHLRGVGTTANSTAINTGSALNQTWMGSAANFKTIYVVCTAFTSGSVSVQLGLTAAPYTVVILNTVNTLDSNSAASKADLDTIVTNTNKIPASPAQEGGNLATLAGIVTASKAAVNVAQVAGTTTDTNSGVKSAGTQRVVLATDQPALTNKLLVTPDSVALPAHQSVNVDQWNGTTPDTNSGVKSAGTLRVVLATDQPALTNAQPVSESGTWTVQPGNTQNTTAWLIAQISNNGGYPYTIKEIKNVSITAGTGLSVWTPANGKKFWLIGWSLGQGAGTAAIMFQDTVTINSANEFIRAPRLGSANTTPNKMDFYPHGYLSSAANNQLWIDVSATVTVEGYVYGFEV